MHGNTDPSLLLPLFNTCIVVFSCCFSGGTESLAMFSHCLSLRTMYAKSNMTEEKTRFLVLFCCPWAKCHLQQLLAWSNQWWWQGGAGTGNYRYHWLGTPKTPWWPPGITHMVFTGWGGPSRTLGWVRAKCLQLLLNFWWQIPCCKLWCWLHSLVECLQTVWHVTR